MNRLTHTQPLRCLDDTEATPMLAGVLCLVDAAVELLPIADVESPLRRRAAGGLGRVMTTEWKAFSEI